MTDHGNKINWKTVIFTTGAYISYAIGSGFASGQEVLQFFGSWGGVWTLFLPLISLVAITLFCSISFNVSRIEQFENPSNAYEYFFGKYAAKFMDVFSMIMIGGIGLVMFAGCGAALNQYFGTPVWIGSLILGVVSVIVVWLGLERIIQVLGACGITMVLFVVIIGIYSIATAEKGLMEAQQNVLDYVAEGSIFQAGVFGIYNPVLSGFYYAGMCLLCNFPFIVAMGQKMGNSRTSTASAVSCAAVFTVAVLLVLVAILQQIDYVVEINAPIPMLVAYDRLLPQLSFIFTIMIVIEIFTTIVGYLWVIGRRFSKDKTTKQKIIVAAVAAAGILTGSIIPFSKLLNVLYPFAGCIGFIMLIALIVSAARKYKQYKERKEIREN